MQEAQKPFYINILSDHMSIKLNGDCELSSLKPFHDELETYLKDGHMNIILNCDHLDSLSKDWVRELIHLQGLLKSQSKSMRLILVKAHFKRQLTDLGLDSVFKVCTNLREALSDFGIVTKRMLDTNFVNPFLTATLHVLEVQASVKSNAGKPYLKKDDDQSFGDISGVIGIVSDSFNGAVVISFPAQTFLKIMSSMLGEEFKELNQDILDGAGEITNMIFGHAKVVLNEKGYGIKTALPSVVTGKDHSLSSITNGPVVVVPFTSDIGDFFVEISLS